MAEGNLASKLPFNYKDAMSVLLFFGSVVGVVVLIAKVKPLKKLVHG